jgi:two-component system, OmpR family, response regulator MprA
MAAARILVVDDEEEVRESLRLALELEDYDVVAAEDGHEALEALHAGEIDAMLLDVAMPRLGGLELCRRLRAAGNRVPILMLTAKEGVDDRVEGLEAGADDYLPKPFALRELLARLKAIMRRTGERELPDRLVYSDVTVDRIAQRAWRGERLLELTRTEFHLLELLAAHPEQVLTRTRIHLAIWGYDFGTDSNSLGVFVGYLRRKLEEGGEPRVVHTVRGVGYVLRADP